MGWEDIDFTDDRYADPAEILKVCQTQGMREGEVTDKSGPAQMTDVFRNHVKVGDILIVTKGNGAFRAIGEVTGEYGYEQRENRRYSHRRAVRWLWVDRKGMPAQEIYDGNFTMRSIYQIDRNRFNIAALTRFMNS